MRTKKSFINMLASIFVAIEITLAGMFNRRFFIQNLSMEYLGCNAVFSNVLELLSVVCCGASAVSYLAVKAMARDDRNSIQCVFQMIHIYQWVSCGLLASAGCVLAFIFPGFLQNTTAFSWEFLQQVYLLFLAEICLSNWSGFTGSPGYYDCMIKASQNMAVCSVFDFITTNIYMILQCVILVYTKNYLLYLGIGSAAKIVYIILTRNYCYKKFPYLRQKTAVTWEQMKETKLFSEIRNNLVVTIAAVVFNGTDSIVITSTLGITITALYSNYQVLYNQLRRLAGKFLNGMSVSVADFLHKTCEDEKKRTLFYRVQFLCAITGIICCCGLYGLAQPFIFLFFGKELLLELKVVFVLSLLLFLIIFSIGCAMFRHAMGKYWIDRNYQMVSAAVNLLLSVLLAKRIGIEGILLGTIAGSLIATQGYLKVIRKEAIVTFTYREWWMQGWLWSFFALTALCLSDLSVSKLNFSIPSICLRAVFSLTAALSVILAACAVSRTNRNCAVFYFNKIKQVFMKFRRRMKHGIGKER